jgi:hypothetical protein
MFWLLLIGLATAGEEVVTLKKGQHAPFSGTLLSPAAAARLLATGESDLAKCKSDAIREKKLLEADLNLKLKQKEAELVACRFKSKEINDINKEHIKFLEKRSISPSWEKPVTFAAGILAGVGVVTLSAWTLDKIR